MCCAVACDVPRRGVGLRHLLLGLLVRFASNECFTGSIDLASSLCESLQALVRRLLYRRRIRPISPLTQASCSASLAARFDEFPIDQTNKSNNGDRQM